MALEITDQSFKELLASGQPFVVDFWAEWCGPCRTLAPIIDELSSEYEGKVTIGKLDIDNETDTPNEYGIMSIPTVLFFKDGQMVEKHVGSAPKAILEEKVKKLL